MRKNIYKILMYVLIFLVLSINVFSTVNYEKYNSFETKKIVGLTNLHKNNLDYSSRKFNVPEEVLKSVFGVFTEQGISNVKDYDSNGRIGVMGLIPFLDDGQSYHYHQCLESKCMSAAVSDDLSVEFQREAVKRDYSSFENSICCAAYIMNQINKKSKGVSVVFPKKDSQCFSLRSQATYTDWEGVVREYVGTGCINNDIHLYFIEKYSQLFEAFKTNDFTAYGILKFTPAFSIKAPVLINVYYDVRDFVTDTMKECKDDPTETCVKDQQQKFIKNHKNMSFIDFCEEPEINIINSIYDRLVNAYETQKDNCKYLIASQEPGLPNGNTTFINLTSNPQNPEVKIYNSLKGYGFYTNDARFAGDRLFKIEGYSNYLSYKFKNRFPSNNFIGDFRKIYLLKNSSLSSNDFLFVFENQAGDFYNMLNQEIDVSSYPTCREKYKYFTCLDTNMTEQVFDWMTWSWKESVDTIKVKFAFQIPK